MWMKRLLMIAALAAPSPVLAQDDWNYRTTLYGWATGLASTVDTPQGEIETEIEFEDVLDDLDFAVFGAFEANKGRWSVVFDAMYADLTTDLNTPLDGAPFSRGEVETQLVMLTSYGMYSVVDDDKTSLQVGGGVRYFNTTIDTSLIGQGAAPDVAFSVDGDWVDLVLAARLTQSFTEKWYGVGYADIGGFGIGDESSDLTWQGFAGVGYRFNETWATTGGYRYLSIERELSGQETTTEIYGPYLGLQISF